MPTTVEQPRWGTPIEIVPTRWELLGDTETYECRVLLCPESDGGFSVHASSLPGVVSQGDSIGEALENIREAFHAVVSTYRESGQEIPWESVEIDAPIGSLERWILVNV